MTDCTRILIQTVWVSDVINIKVISLTPQLLCVWEPMWLRQYPARFRVTIRLFPLNNFCIRARNGIGIEYLYPIREKDRPNVILSHWSSSLTSFHLRRSIIVMYTRRYLLVLHKSGYFICTLAWCIPSCIQIWAQEFELIAHAACIQWRSLNKFQVCCNWKPTL